MNSQWFVIYTKPHHEKKVGQQLDKINIEHYLPLVKTLKNWSDRKKYIDAPLFPSYLFVKLPDTQSYFRSLEINGVLYYVRNGKQIAPISETIIANLKSFIPKTADEIEISFDNIQPGTILYIKDGPFVGCCCEVIRYHGKQKLLVRVELLKRNVLMNIPSEYLMSLQPATIC